MRKSIASLTLAVLATLSLCSCVAGPHQCRRSCDDWDRQMYVNSPWWNATLWLVPVIPACYLICFATDFLFSDPYAFWLDDAWDGVGTGFEHLHVVTTDGTMSSLLSEGSGWLQTSR